jgi:hypothetical protein
MMDARSYADALIASWISRYGVPSQITKYRGRQFYVLLVDCLVFQAGNLSYYHHGLLSAVYWNDGKSSPAD